MDKTRLNSYQARVVTDALGDEIMFVEEGAWTEVCVVAELNGQAVRLIFEDYAAVSVELGETFGSKDRRYFLGVAAGPRLATCPPRSSWPQ